MSLQTENTYNLVLSCIEPKNSPKKAPSVYLQHVTIEVTQTVAFVNVNLPQKLVVRAFHLSQSAATLTFKILPLPSGQNLADSVGNLRGLWLLVEGIHGEIWVVSETRIHVEIQGKFLNRG